VNPRNTEPSTTNAIRSRSAGCREYRRRCGHTPRVIETREPSPGHIPCPVGVRKEPCDLIEPVDCDLDSSGEVPHLVLHRPFRWDRAGLFYFGRRCAGWTVTLSSRELAALANGRQILIAPGTEYLLLVRTVTKPSTASPRPLAALNGRKQHDKL
jgi:hypothetical protein